MRFEQDGRVYELLLGSDVPRDAMYLELNDVSGRRPRTLLFGEKREGANTEFLVFGAWP